MLCLNTPSLTVCCFGAHSDAALVHNLQRALHFSFCFLPQEVGANLFVGGLDPEVDEKVGCCAALCCAVLLSAAPALRPLIELRCTALAFAAGVLQTAQASAAPLLPAASQSTHLLFSSLLAAALRHLLSIWSGGGRPEGALLGMLPHAVLRAVVCACVCQKQGASWYAACLQGQLS